MSTPDEYHLDPDQAPNWAVSPEHDVRCPECNDKISGLNWVIDHEKQQTTGMTMVPCGHVLSTDTWELAFSGRDRRNGTIIRTPIIQRREDADGRQVR